MLSKSDNTGRLSRISVIFILVFITSVFSAMAGSPDQDFTKHLRHLKKNKIVWQAPHEEKGRIVKTGAVAADFGRFEFQWILEPEKKTIRLVTIEAPGAGELPAEEKKVLPLVVNSGVTILFLEWPPLLHSKKPYTIRAVAGVSTADLFSALPELKKPPSAPEMKTPRSIVWNNITVRKGVQYLEGAVKASFGTLDLYWKKEEGRVPELVTIEAPGAGELPPVEAKLLPWMDEGSGLTIICQERRPQLNESFPAYLAGLVMVKTADLMAGFDRLNQ